MRGSSYVVRACDHRVRASRPRAANTVKGGNSRTSVSQDVKRPLSDHSDNENKAAEKRTQEWVNRPADVRRRESEERKYTARPPNSFMLYRSAYIPVAKARYAQRKQQNLSTIVGCSWRIESQKVRWTYEQYAMIERYNHYEAHPDYKFSPQKPTMKKEVISSEEPETISEDLYGCGECPLAAAANKDQDWDMTPCPIDTDASVQSTAPDAFVAWLPTLMPAQAAFWQGQYGDHETHYQVPGNNVLWPSVVPTPLFLRPCGASREPPMDSMAFPTVPNANGLPAANQLWGGAGVNYAMPAHDPSYCDYPYPLGEPAAPP